jgi:hypothetical protein
MREVRLERLSETFAGSLELMRQELELMDIDDPLEELQRLRELFLEFTDLPGQLREQLAGADLTTSEGRQAFEQLLLDLFRQVQAGEIDVGALGELTLDQLLQAIGDLEGLADKVSEEAARGGRSEEFTRTRSITEVTGMRMVGVLTTIDFRVAQIVSMMRQGLGLSPTSGIEPVPGAPEMMPAQMGGTSLTVQTRVEQGAIQVSGAGDPAATAAAVRDSLTDEVSEQLASDVLERLRANGVIGGERMLRAGRN